MRQVEWTKEQQQIIGLRNRNILVAAAAGSGKTAVLVERILSMITDEAHPVDIDRLLVVTFTNAAAAQMRERIGKRLAEKFLEEPGNRNLKRQEDLLPHAKIMTIDSFCLFVVRNYFNVLNLDPEFRIGDAGELKLLREDAMKELLEREYTEGAPAFLHFVESYSEGKGDDSIAEYIERLHQFASAYPDREEQLALWEKQLSGEQAGEAPFMERFLSEIYLEASELKARYEKAQEISREAGLFPYEEMFRSDGAIAERLLSAKGYPEIQAVLSGIKDAFVKKPAISKKLEFDQEKKDFLSSLRDELKAVLTDLAARYDMGPEEQALSDMEGCREPLTELLHLAGKFGEAFQKAKEERNLVDFNDVSHYALKILTVREGEEYRPSMVAEELRESFHEIMIDEYQDSNRLQEAILTSVSTADIERPNIFMVGDVKQSIYKFRQARPELFMEKYDTYTLEDSDYQKIDLHRNFRSREEVLHTVNFLFSQLMERKLGGITYDEAAALVPGREFPEAGKGTSGQQDYRTEILFLDSGKAKSEDKELQDYQSKELEAKVIAKRIREITDPDSGLPVLDPGTGEYRTACYKDIVILLRTMEGWAETFIDCLMEEGIPAYAQTRTGYFSAREIRTLLDLLRIIDNPMQDIPLAAVMTSPIGGFSPEELAVIKAEFNRSLEPGKTRGIYGALQAYSGKEADGTGLSEKVRRFLSLLEDFRARAVYMRLHRLLRYILEKTEYGYILSAMPGGKLRMANVEMLIKRAVDYETTSYHGVFQFVRYIERLQKYSVDFGEASLSGSGENAVQITSIHKSKGLEYPIVILAGAGKRFNQEDSNGKILLHPDLGIAADYIDTGNRMKAATLPKQVLQKQLRLDNLGEELRVLYVALTRAEEKLIITGTDTYLETRLTKWNSQRLSEEQSLSYQAVSRGGSYLEWILMALARSRAYGQVLSERGITPPVLHRVYGEQVPVSFRIETVEGLVRHETVRQTENLLLKEQLLHWTGEADSSLEQEIKARLSWQYPHLAASAAPRIFSVSELKASEWTKEQPLVRLAPRFMEEEPLAGAEKGTAYHRLLELLPFTTAPEEIEAAVKELEAQELLPSGTAEKLNLNRIRRFLRSSLGKRMAEGERQGTLKKEAQFVMSLPAEEVGEEYLSLSGERILIQGVIDAWFEEEDGLVIVDYKTDRVEGLPDPEGYLTGHYKTQLEYYKRALEMGSGKQVKELWIYSFSLGRAIPVR